MADDFFGQKYKTQRSNRSVDQDLEALSAPVKSQSSAADEKDDVWSDANQGDVNPFKQRQDDDDAMGGYTIDDLLNGYVMDEETLSSIDGCLIHILSEWDLSDILSKDITDCERLLIAKCNDTHSKIINSIVDSPTVLYDTLLRIARKIKAISLVVGNQKMIYVPSSIEELEDIGDQLVGLNTLISVRTNRFGHKSVASPDDPALEDDRIKLFNEDDRDDSKSMDEPLDLESLIFTNRQLYKATAICKKREKKYMDKDKGILTTLKKPKDTEEHMVNSRELNAVNEEQELQSINKNTMKKAHPNNIHCEGCGNLISFLLDHDRVIVYTVAIKASQLFYFHDTFCVTLRRLKESIRRYVLDESLPEARRSDTTIGYIHNLLRNFNTLITTRGTLPRPNPVMTAHNKDDEENTMMRFVRSSAHKLILRQLALEGREAKNFEDEYSWKFSNIPMSIQYTDMVVYGPCLAEYVIQQLLSKQLASLWLTLAFITSGCSATTSLHIIEEHRTHLAKVKEMEYLDVMLSSMIEASDYTIAMALYLSAYMMENAERDLSRSDDFEEVASKYIRIASSLVGSVESDHLLSLLLETPTDIEHLSVFEIAIKYGIEDFMDDARIQMLMVHMWTEFDFLDPAVNFRTQDIEFAELMSLLASNPARFYYCPVGRYWTWSVMYLVYIGIVSTVLYEANYEMQSDLSGPEFVMWIFNAGFVMGELTQMAFEGVAYLTDVGNYFDVFLMINWAILALMRFGCKTVFVSSDQCYGSNSNETIDDAHSRNKPVVLVYMAIFCAQICVLWSRVCLIFATSRNVGPFISMIPGMVKDILRWTFVLGIFYIGYSFGVHFIIAGDISEFCGADGHIESFSVVAEYNFILLMGQSEWSILEANDCMDSSRSLLLKLYMYGFSVLGTVLLLNLLIAMMASTYEQIREGTAKQVNFARAEQTFTLAHRDAIIPPPLNVIVFALSLVWFLLEFLVWLCSAGHLMLNIENLVPVQVDYTADFDEFTNKNARNIDKTHLKCCKLCQKVKEPKGLTKKMAKHHAETARYCQFCRCYMRINGNVSHYFKLFVNYRLDEADVKFMKSLMRTAGICPQCYRPYRIYQVTETGTKTNRLFRWQVILELVSFYVFMLIIYIPLIILIALPALFGAILNRFDDIKSATKLVEGTTEIMKDDKYVQLVENIVEKEGTTDTEVLSTQVAQLNRKLIQIKMNQQTAANVLAEQSIFLEKHSQILRGMVPYIKGIDVKMDKSMSTTQVLHEKQMETFEVGMQQQHGVLETHTDYNKEHQQQLQQQMSVAQQHREEMALFKQQLDELKILRTEDEKLKKEQALRQEALEKQHAREIKDFNKELKQQRVLREMEAMKLAKQSKQQTTELQKVHKEQLNTLQQQIERQKFLRVIEEQRIKEAQETRALETERQQQDMAILKGQMEQIRLLKEAEDKRHVIELKLRKQEGDKMKHVEKEILDIKKAKERRKNQRDSLSLQQTKRMQELERELLKMKTAQRRQKKKDKQTKEVEEIKDIQRKSKVRELKNQWKRLAQEQNVTQKETAAAKRKREKSRMKHQIQIEKINKSITMLQLNIPDDEEEVKEDKQDEMKEDKQDGMKEDKQDEMKEDKQDVSDQYDDEEDDDDDRAP